MNQSQLHCTRKQKLFLLSCYDLAFVVQRPYISSAANHYSQTQFSSIIFCLRISEKSYCIFLCLTSFNKMSFSCIHCGAGQSISLCLWLNNIPLCLSISFYPFIPCMVIYCTLVTVNSTAINMGIQGFLCFADQISLGYLDKMIHGLLVFCGTPILCCTIAVLIYILSNSSIFAHIYANLSSLSF